MKKHDKKDLASKLIQKGDIWIYLDPRKPNVVLPERLKLQPQVVLTFGLDMVVPIPNLVIDEEGISGTLSFKRIPFYCSIPWETVFAITGSDLQGHTYMKDMPQEVLRDIKKPTGPCKLIQPMLKSERPYLKLVR